MEQEKAQLAAVRVRGKTGVKSGTSDTLNMLRLYKNNYCAVFPNNPVYAGMLMKAKDYITWGEIDNDTFKMLLDKRGEEFKQRTSDTKNKIKYDDFITVNSRKLKKFFRLNAPRKGFERKGVKQTFKNGGALGYRGAAINGLIKRMV